MLRYAKKGSHSFSQMGPIFICLYFWLSRGRSGWAVYIGQLIISVSSNISVSFCFYLLLLAIWVLLEDSVAGCCSVCFPDWCLRRCGGVCHWSSVAFRGGLPAICPWLHSPSSTAPLPWCQASTHLPDLSDSISIPFNSYTHTHTPHTPPPLSWHTQTLRCLCLKHCLHFVYLGTSPPLQC